MYLGDARVKIKGTQHPQRLVHFYSILHGRNMSQYNMHYDSTKYSSDCSLFSYFRLV